MRDTTVVFAQTPLLKSQLEELKRLSGTTATKDALQAAVNHYLNCPLMRERGEGKREEDWWWSLDEKEKEEEEGRKNLGGDKK